jgi:restriction system protein
MRTIGVELVRQLYGAMVGEEAHAAIFVTSGSYTPDAIAFASNKPIKLVDGHDLDEMLRGVQTRSSRPMTKTPTIVATPAIAAVCPRCGSSMVHRVARRGAERGRAFWGCSRYPLCSGTRP